MRWKRIMGHFVPAIPVHINEFAQRGISFDYNRFCAPLITDAVLHEVLGEKKSLLVDYLETHVDGTYYFKSHIHHATASGSAFCRTRDQRR